MEFKDYYQTLGVERSAPEGEIKRAYRKLARKYHPDVSKEHDASERMKAINEAYEVLKDPEKRAAYDRLGAGWQPGQDFHPPPDWDAGFEFRGSPPARASQGTSAIFSPRYSGAPPGRGMGRGSTAAARTITPGSSSTSRTPSAAPRGP